MVTHGQVRPHEREAKQDLDVRLDWVVENNFDRTHRRMMIAANKSYLENTRTAVHLNLTRDTFGESFRQCSVTRKKKRRHVLPGPAENDTHAWCTNAY